MNEWNGIGRLTDDVELKSITRDGATIPYVNITVAIDRQYRGKEGAQNTDFFPMVAWRKTAELIHQLCQKGTLVRVKCNLNRRKWEDKGVWMTDFTVDEFEALGQRKPKEQVTEDAGAPDDNGDIYGGIFN